MDIWGTLKKTVSAGAPMLANAIIPGSGGLAASILGKVLGVDPNSPEAMLKAVQTASPEKWAELRQAEMKHEAELARIAADLDKAYLADRQDARSRDVKLTQAGYHNYRADIMLSCAFASFVFIAWMINAGENIKPEVLAIFNMAIGALLKMISDAFQFEFGSSRGSKEKDALKGVAK